MRRELDVRKLDAFAPDVMQAWRELAARCSDATIFVHPDWLRAWHAHLGDDVEPELRGVYDGERLVGLAPFGVARDGGRRVLGLLGGDVSDYRGVLALPEWGPAVARALLVQLAKEHWDVCELGPIEACSPLARASAPGLALELRDADVCPYVPIPEGARELADVVPRGFASRVARSIRTAQRAGRHEVSWGEADEALARLETFIALHAARARMRGGVGVLDDPRVRAFWRDAAPPLAREGILRMLEVRLDGRAIASVFAFFQHGRVLSYLGGFDPMAAKLSPGRLALAALFTRAIDEGAREVDFLRGVETYKYAWGAQDRVTHRLRIVRAAGRR